MKTAPHNAHVRARQAILRRVVARRLKWGAKGASVSDVRKRAQRQLAAFRWPGHDWGVKYGAYSPYGGGSRVLGRYVDVPASIVHGIMCTSVD